MKCPKCNLEIIGEANNFCRHCLYSFDTGGNRWFTLDDEEAPVREID